MQADCNRHNRDGEVHSVALTLNSMFLAGRPTETKKYIEKKTNVLGKEDREGSIVVTEDVSAENGNDCEAS